MQRLLCVSQKKKQDQSNQRRTQHTDLIEKAIVFLMKIDSYTEISKSEKWNADSRQN